MAINAKNVGKLDAPKAKKPSESSLSALRPKKEQIEKPREKSLKANYTIEKKEVKGVASSETALLVNGKQKSIGRKSHYLLDMLTLDDE